MKRLKKVYIEITNVCNLACKFCPQTRRKPEFMDIRTFSKILDQIKPHTGHVYFHVKGEPLLHPDIDRFLDLCHEKGFKVNLTTNGTLIGKVGEKILGKPALRQVNFSLHSLDGNEEFKDATEYMDPIFSFIREAVMHTNTLMALRLWNLDSKNDLDSGNKKNQMMLDAIEKEFDLDYKIEEKVITGGGMKISDRVYLNQDYEFQWPDLKEEEDLGKGFCHGLRNQAAILVDGTVVPCCLDGEGIISLGNIQDTPFSEIITSDRAKRLYDGFSRREVNEELCRKCGYRKRFNIL